MANLPEWKDEWSDGCSIPFHLKRFLIETPAMRACCVKHDKKYYYGGSIKDRLVADAEFLLDLLEAGIEPIIAEEMYKAVRLLGGPSAQQPYSWAFGGKRYRYDSKSF